MSATPHDPTRPDKPPTALPGIAGTESVTRGSTAPGEPPPAAARDDEDLFATVSPREIPYNVYSPFDSRNPALPCRFGSYILEARIAAGGMGIVYRARQLFNPANSALGRVVALKMILPEKVGSPQVVQRFLGEAHNAARLEYHPNIVQIYDVGEVDGQPYFSMQFIAGGSLQQVVDERFVLPPPTIARLIKKIADAAQFAHTEANIIHRDIKPSNILLGRDTRSENEINLDQPADESVSFNRCVPKLTDFGLAHNADSNLTTQGEVMGTPSYMPPEQARGDLSRIGPPSDVYSLGAVLYALLTGCPPFEASDPAGTITRLLHDDPIPPRLTDKGKKTPLDLEQICLKCLEKDPTRRYKSAQALSDDLQRFLTGEPVHAKPPQPLSWMLRKVRRRFWPIAGTLVVLACLVVTAGFLWHQYTERQKEREREQREYKEAVEQVQAFHLKVEEATPDFSDWQKHAGPVFGRLRRLSPEPTTSREGAKACYRLALKLWERGHKSSAIQAAETAQAIGIELETRQRLDATDRLIRAEARTLLGRINHERMYHEEAEGLFQDAINDLEAISDRNENVLLLQATVHHSRGEMYNAQARRREAVAAYSQSIEIRQKLVQKQKHLDRSNRDYFNDLARGHGYLGDTYLDLGDLEKAAAAYESAELLRIQLHREFGDDRTRQQLARSHANTGRLRQREKKHDESLRAFQQAVTDFQSIVRNSNRRIAEFRDDLGGASLELAEALVDAARPPEGLNDPHTLSAQAEEEFNNLLRDDPGNSSHRRNRARARLNLAYLLPVEKSGEAVELLANAESELRDLATKRGAEEPQTLYLLGVVESIRAERTPTLAADHLREAVFKVKLAVNHGFANAAQIETDRRLQACRRMNGADLADAVKKCREKRTGR